MRVRSTLESYKKMMFLGCRLDIKDGGRVLCIIHMSIAMAIQLEHRHFPLMVKKNVKMERRQQLVHIHSYTSTRAVRSLSSKVKGIELQIGD